MKRRNRQITISGFLLLEVMLAVAIFAIGVISLGACVNNCLSAQAFRKEDQRAREALRNQMAQIQAGAIAAAAKSTTPMDGQYAGITIQQNFEPLKWKNENGQDISNLYAVHLDASWMSGTQKESKTLTFYITQ